MVEVDHAASTEASSSSQGPRSVPTGIARSAPIETAESHKRDPVEAEPDEGDEGEVPVKVERIFSICVRHGAADKIGEVKAKEYDVDLKGNGGRVSGEECRG